MDQRDEVFADNLLRALGLKSITLHPRTPKSEDETSYLGATGIHGRSVFSARNRRLVQRALESSPPPETLREFVECLTSVAAEKPGEEVDEILAAARDASREDPDGSLTGFAQTQA